ncbi:MAG: hypothetical protein ABIA47_02925 [bacterium]
MNGGNLQHIFLSLLAIFALVSRAEAIRPLPTPPPVQVEYSADSAESDILSLSQDFADLQNRVRQLEIENQELQYRTDRLEKLIRNESSH